MNWNRITLHYEIVLMALLSSTIDGIGTAGSVPSKKRHINKFSDLGTLLKQLTKQLKQKAQFKQKRGRMYRKADFLSYSQKLPIVTQMLLDMLETPVIIHYG
ncbi:hypothetical protein [Photobacterium kasasachensis]|uniref:hypothetical protein n=1 Tax=Photobacterium kasasachensis TaxID=2910240 RepID=UPI003D0CDD82